jgi:uncharacterized membrane protein YkoI
MFRSRLAPCPKFLLTCLSLVMIQPARGGHASEQDEVRRAVQSGQALPFQVVRERISRYCGSCEVLEAKLHEAAQDGRHLLVYEIKAITSDGQVLKLEVDAASGEIFKLKHKGSRAAR